MPSAPPTSAQLGAAIRLRREEREITIEDLAGKAKIHWTYLSSIERGKANPSWDILRKLATALEVEITEFMHVDGDRHAPDG